MLLSPLLGSRVICETGVIKSKMQPDDRSGSIGMRIDMPESSYLHNLVAFLSLGQVRAAIICSERNHENSGFPRRL